MRRSGRGHRQRDRSHPSRLPRQGPDEALVPPRDPPRRGRPRDPRSGDDPLLGPRCRSLRLPRLRGRREHRRRRGDRQVDPFGRRHRQVPRDQHVPAVLLSGAPGGQEGRPARQEEGRPHGLRSGKRRGRGPHHRRALHLPRPLRCHHQRGGRPEGEGSSTGDIQREQRPGQLQRNRSGRRVPQALRGLPDHVGDVDGGAPRDGVDCLSPVRKPDRV
mmetsp:Transcript_12903/g.27303  ORF Transcript_12903/g.27303 Transcript_12903/m.27303 type:complete len:217 (+) Transcript_12903:597-1247(+)